jgi:hypothetical protein
MVSKRQQGVVLSIVLHIFKSFRRVVFGCLLIDLSNCACVTVMDVK